MGLNDIHAATGIHWKLARDKRRRTWWLFFAQVEDLQFHSHEGSGTRRLSLCVSKDKGYPGSFGEFDLWTSNGPEPIHFETLWRQVMEEKLWT